MRIPVVRGLIDRRILVNYRVDPRVLSRILPRPFRPKLVNGTGVAGVCLIRLKHVRPRPLPGFLGLSNVKSRRVMEKVGFRHEGDFEYAGLQHVLYRLRRAESTGDGRT